MPILVTCKCGKKFRADEKHAGKQTACPKCGQALDIAGPHVSAYDVFVSYSSKDKTTCDALVATFESKGLRCWIAPRDILPGANWGEAIIGGIEQCQVMVLVFSAHSNESPQVKREVERAVSKGIPVIPLRIEDVKLSRAMEYFISSQHWLDALTPPLEHHLEELTRKVIRLLTDDGSSSSLPSRSGPDPIPTALPASDWTPPAPDTLWPGKGNTTGPMGQWPVSQPSAASSWGDGSSYLAPNYPHGRTARQSTWWLRIPLHVRWLAIGGGAALLALLVFNLLMPAAGGRIKIDIPNSATNLNMKPLAAESIPDVAKSRTTDPAPADSAAAPSPADMGAAVSKSESPSPAPDRSIVPPDAVAFQGHSYKYYGEKLSWKEAKQRCAKMGGHLPIVETAAENAFLVQLADKGFPSAARSGSESVWLGATDEVTEGEWRWIDGARVSYTNWLDNQPGNFQGKEHYALLCLDPKTNRGSGGWADLPNVADSMMGHFICEWDSVAATTTAEPILKNAGAPTEVAWTELFNGQDLTGWTAPVLPENWEVRNGVIVGKGIKTSALFADETYDDFELDLEFKLAPGSNSGIWIRAPNNTEVIFGGAKRAMSISLIDDASPVWVNDIKNATKRTGGLHAVAGPNPLSSATAGKWNRLLIRAFGPQIAVTINGTQVVDVNTAEYVARLPEYTGITRTGGYIGLEDNAQDGVEFRNIRIRDLSARSTAAPAADLTAMQGVWRVVAEEFHGVPTSPEELGPMRKTLTVISNSFVIERSKNGKPQKLVGTIQLVPNSSPKQFDWSGTGYDGTPLKLLGLYELNADKLRLVFDWQSQDSNTSRPTKFASIDGTSINVITLQRATAASEWTELFNGKDLTGWTPVASKGAWRVKDGNITATLGTGWLASDRDHADFEMELEYRIQPGGNTGIFLRAPPDGAADGVGLLEIQIIDETAAKFQNVPDRNRTGALIGLFAVSPRAQAPPNTWNKMSVRADGTRITVVVNGLKVSDGNLADEPRDAMTAQMRMPTGRIGLQRGVLNGSEFRNIRIRELNENE